MENFDIDVNEPDQFGTTPLHLLVTHGRLPLMRRLIEQFEADYTVNDNMGRSVLYLAFKHCQDRETITYVANLFSIHEESQQEDVRCYVKMFAFSICTYFYLSFSMFRNIYAL